MSEQEEKVQKINILINEVRAIHVSVDREHDIPMCEGCFEDWPCSTILMIEHYIDLMEVLTFLREPVLEFAEEMEKKLRKHDGDKSGWIFDNSPHSLDELRMSLSSHLFRLTMSTGTWPYNYDKLISDAADVANFAMMIADNARLWKEEAKKEVSSDEGH